VSSSEPAGRIAIRDSVHVLSAHCLSLPSRPVCLSDTESTSRLSRRPSDQRRIQRSDKSLGAAPERHPDCLTAAPAADEVEESR
jgi:hypothetical protein